MPPDDFFEGRIGNEPREVFPPDLANDPSKNGLILESLCQPQRMQFCIRIYIPFTSVLKSGNQIIISKCFFLELKFILSKARGRKK